ncbi:hypothetical protein DFH08DRAFT_950948 [Mycena albidolilacea]|uniref:Uncharacterized protein n=1 Tax=Mycena albidolilacea TaxID=1033008 RepID=A0AAD7F3C0_9AGAR|nr:hypothetical protein DFH08DRAFT_950948 [Mycena albidolilacea]
MSALNVVSLKQMLTTTESTSYLAGSTLGSDKLTSTSPHGAVRAVLQYQVGRVRYGHETLAITESSSYLAGSTLGSGKVTSTSPRGAVGAVLQYQVWRVRYGRGTLVQLQEAGD